MKSITTQLFVLLTVLSTQLFGTTIAPFENLGEMARNTELVVRAKVVNQFDKEINNSTKFWSELEIINTVKGNLSAGERIIIQNYHTKIGDIERTVWGDLELEEGKTYLLFLSNMYENVWQATMLSYAAFEEVDYNNERLFVPFGLGTEYNFVTPPGQDKAEKLGVYQADQLVMALQQIAAYKMSWNKDNVLSRYSLSEINKERMLPGHCSTLSGGANYARWDDIENTALPIYYHMGLDPGCTNTVAQIDNAITNINTNYTGLSVVNQGTHNFNPGCANGDAIDNDFTSYVNSTYGDNRRHLIIFDDPCDEIPNLSGCSGTLAFGGLYWSSSTYSFNGSNWRYALYGYVVVNNGTGACQCPSSDYEIMMTHELTHSLNIGHIVSGTANMNPSCCNSITTLDEECLDFIYASPLPVELDQYYAKLEEESVALTWSTFSEINNNFFTIERKSEFSDYEVIGRVNSTESERNSADYSFVDENPVNGVNYYRLSQTDYDGTKEILGTRSVKILKDFNVEIYPNPIEEGNLQLNISSKSSSTANVEIYLISGKLMYSTARELKEGNNHLSISLPNDQKGLFFVKVQQGQSTVISKFIN